MKADKAEGKMSAESKDAYEVYRAKQAAKGEEEGHRRRQNGLAANEGG